MTFIVALPMRDSAVLASDTGSYNASGADMGDVGGKLVALRGGWGAGSGLLAWTRAAFDAIRPYEAKDVAAQVAAIRALRESDLYHELDAAAGSDWADQRAAALRDVPANVRTAAGTLGRLVTLFRTAGGYRGTILTDTADTVPLPTGRPFVAPPPDLSLATVQGHLRSWGGPPRGWEATRQQIGETFAWARSRSTMVGGRVEAAFLTPGGDRYVAELLEGACANP
jgi:hypothetical protein